MYTAQAPARSQRTASAASHMPSETARRLPLAIAYTPVQCFSYVMDEAQGLRKGTIFEELYLPLEEGGLARGR